MARATWNYSDDYSAQWFPTTNDNVRVVILSDDDAEQPYDEASAPTLIGSGWGIGSYSPADHTDVSGVLDAAIEACHHYGEIPSGLDSPESIAARYLRVFHGVTAIHTAGSNIDRYANVVMFDTIPWREHVGISLDSTLTRDDVASDWVAYLDGEVYSVGYQVRVLSASMFDADPIEEWDTVINCGGFYGETYARESALGDYCDLPAGVSPLTTNGK